MRFLASIIKVQNLRKVYRVGKEKVVALDDICLEIGEGEMCCIVGASGSGKSTLLNQLAGLEKPTKGHVFIGKNDISRMSENQLAEFRQQHLGFIFQSYNLLPSLTAAENVALPLMFKGVGRKEREKRARAELKKMGLLARAGHKPTEMSGGQQQRVGIARAFVAKPKVIFADEPTGNLDSTTSRKVLYSMLQMAKHDGITFVMVTHEKELAYCGDRIVTIKDGRVVDNVLLTDEQKAANRAGLFGGLDLTNADVAEPETNEEEPTGKKGAARRAAKQKAAGAAKAPGGTAQPEKAPAAQPQPPRTTAEKAQAVQQAAAQAIRKKTAQEGEESK